MGHRQSGLAESPVDDDVDPCLLARLPYPPTGPRDRTSSAKAVVICHDYVPDQPEVWQAAAVLLEKVHGAGLDTTKYVGAAAWIAVSIHVCCGEPCLREMFKLGYSPSADASIRTLNGKVREIMTRFGGWVAVPADFRPTEVSEATWTALQMCDDEWDGDVEQLCRHPPNRDYTMADRAVERLDRFSEKFLMANVGKRRLLRGGWRFVD